MGLARRPHKVNLIVGLLSNDTEMLAAARDSLRRMFGPTDLESPVVDFTQTDYYAKEMGNGLKRQFLSFKKPYSLKGLCAVKQKTNSLEKKFANNGRRTVNIDPGYIDLSKLVLFSTKDYSHRLYLDKGIFAEVTLVYKDKSFAPWPWTYPDYRTNDYIKLFNRIRDIYKAKLPCS
jgi:hypothetical protein